MKLRIEFNDGKTFNHYALVVFKVGFQITYLCSGLLIFSVMFMHLPQHFQEFGPEIWQEIVSFYFPTETVDCMNCDEID